MRSSMTDLLLSSAGVPAFAFCADEVKGEQYGAAHPLHENLPSPVSRLGNPTLVSNSAAR